MTGVCIGRQSQAYVLSSSAAFVVGCHLRNGTVIAMLVFLSLALLRKMLILVEHVAEGSMVASAPTLHPSTQPGQSAPEHGLKPSTTGIQRPCPEARRARPRSYNEATSRAMKAQIALPL